MKIDKFGWIIAAAMAGALATSGFQGPSLKFANVDYEKVVTSSNLYKSNSDEIETYRSSRFNILNFIDTNGVMSNSDAREYAQLTLKKNQTDADKARLVKIAADASGQVQKYRDLTTKATPSTEELNQLKDFSAQIQLNKSFVADLKGQYQAALNTEGARLSAEAVDKVHKVISDIASTKGYNIVFSTTAAPFAANNITEEVLSKVNKN